MKEQDRSDIRKYSFSQRKINECDLLSTYCVNASSVNTFTKKTANIPEKQVTFYIYVSMYVCMYVCIYIYVYSYFPALPQVQGDESLAVVGHGRH